MERIVSSFDRYSTEAPYNEVTDWPVQLYVERKNNEWSCNYLLEAQTDKGSIACCLPPASRAFERNPGTSRAIEDQMNEMGVKRKVR